MKLSKALLALTSALVATAGAMEAGVNVVESSSIETSSKKAKSTSGTKKAKKPKNSSKNPTDTFANGVLACLANESLSSSFSRSSDIIPVSMTLAASELIDAEIDSILEEILQALPSPGDATVLDLISAVNSVSTRCFSAFPSVDSDCNEEYGYEFLSERIDEAFHEYNDNFDLDLVETTVNALVVGLINKAYDERADDVIGVGDVNLLLAAFNEACFPTPSMQPSLAPSISSAPSSAPFSPPNYLQDGGGRERVFRQRYLSHEVSESDGIFQKFLAFTEKEGAAMSPSIGYCSWNDCVGGVQGPRWCNKSQKHCEVGCANSDPDDPRQAKWCMDQDSAIDDSTGTSLDLSSPFIGMPKYRRLGQTSAKEDILVVVTSSTAQSSERGLEETSSGGYCSWNGCTESFIMGASWCSESQENCEKGCSTDLYPGQQATWCNGLTKDMFLVDSSETAFIEYLLTFTMDQAEDGYCSWNGCGEGGVQGSNWCSLSKYHCEVGCANSEQGDPYDLFEATWCTDNQSNGEEVETSAVTGYCSWNGCDSGIIPGAPWCNKSPNHCEIGCANSDSNSDGSYEATWCYGSPEETIITAQTSFIEYLSTFTMDQAENGFCSWNGCIENPAQILSQSSSWCSLSKQHCEFGCGSGDSSDLDGLFEATWCPLDEGNRQLNSSPTPVNNNEDGESSNVTGYCSWNGCAEGGVIGAPWWCNLSEKHCEVGCANNDPNDPYQATWCFGSPLATGSEFIQYLASFDEDQREDGYCSWNGCDEYGATGGQWCSLSELHCKIGCTSGQPDENDWCPGKPPLVDGTTSAFVEFLSFFDSDPDDLEANNEEAASIVASLEEGFCSWSDCENGDPSHSSSWCNDSPLHCEIGCASSDPDDEYGARWCALSKGNYESSTNTESIIIRLKSLLGLDAASDITYDPASGGSRQLKKGPASRIGKDHINAMIVQDAKRMESLALSVAGDNASTCVPKAIQDLPAIIIGGSVKNENYVRSACFQNVEAVASVKDCVKSSDANENDSTFTVMCGDYQVTVSTSSSRQYDTLNSVQSAVAHMNAIKTAYVKGYDQVLILESDADMTLVPHWGSAGLDAAFENIPSDYQVLRLFEWNRLPSEMSQDPTPHPFSIDELHDTSVGTMPVWGAVAYVVSRSGMRYLLDRWNVSDKGMDFINTNDHSLCKSWMYTSECLVFAGPGVYQSSRSLFGHQISKETRRGSERMAEDEVGRWANAASTVDILSSYNLVQAVPSWQRNIMYPGSHLPTTESSSKEESITTELSHQQFLSSKEILKARLNAPNVMHVSRLEEVIVETDPSYQFVLWYKLEEGDATAEVAHHFGLKKSELLEGLHFGAHDLVWKGTRLLLINILGENQILLSYKPPSLKVLLAERATGGMFSVDPYDKERHCRWTMLAGDSNMRNIAQNVVRKVDKRAAQWEGEFSDSDCDSRWGGSEWVLANDKECHIITNRFMRNQVGIAEEFLPNIQECSYCGKHLLDPLRHDEQRPSLPNLIWFSHGLWGLPNGGKSVPDMTCEERFSETVAWLKQMQSETQVVWQTNFLINSHPEITNDYLKWEILCQREIAEENGIPLFDTARLLEDMLDSIDAYHMNSVMALEVANVLGIAVYDLAGYAPPELHTQLLEAVQNIRERRYN